MKMKSHWIADSFRNTISLIFYILTFNSTHQYYSLTGATSHHRDLERRKVTCPYTAISCSSPLAPPCVWVTLALAATEVGWQAAMMLSYRQLPVQRSHTGGLRNGEEIVIFTEIDYEFLHNERNDEIYSMTIVTSCMVTSWAQRLSGFRQGHPWGQRVHVCHSTCSVHSVWDYNKYKR